MLAGIAARTNRIQLGALVTGVTYRNPAFLAKVVTTFDVVSSGWAILGIGAAWNEVERAHYGVPACVVEWVTEDGPVHAVGLTSECAPERLKPPA